MGSASAVTKRKEGRRRWAADSFESTRERAVWAIRQKNHNMRFGREEANKGDDTSVGEEL